MLQEVLEEWLVLKLRGRDPLPPVGGIDLNTSFYAPGGVEIAGT
ncbi:MAG: hypothetical protein AB1507_01205 [Bacillota bacterium]